MSIFNDFYTKYNYTRVKFRGGCMKALVVSSSVIIRTGIKVILEELEIIKDIYEDCDLFNVKEREVNLIIIDLNKNNLKYLNEVKKIKDDDNIKILILDFREDKVIFEKCMDIGVDGYVLANIDSEFVSRAIVQISKNKKYFDSDLVERYRSNDRYTGNSRLTSRQEEVIELVVKGKSNKEIADKLFISEHTVKKHISNILFKLELKDRINIATYAIEDLYFLYT